MVMFLATFFFLFLSVYLIGYCAVFRRWPAKQRAEAASSFMSLAHGGPAVVMAVMSFLDSPTATFSAPNSYTHRTIFEFCLAYFFVDTIHYFVFFPKNFLLILHHFATMFVLITCRYIVFHGAHGLLPLIILAECTSPLQNVWSIAGYRRDDSPVAARWRNLLSLPFLILYSIVRGLLGPVYVAMLIFFYYGEGGGRVVPAWASFSWFTVVMVSILVSILWVKDHWVRRATETTGHPKKAK